MEEHERDEHRQLQLDSRRFWKMSRTAAALLMLGAQACFIAAVTETLLAGIPNPQPALTVVMQSYCVSS